MNSRLTNGGAVAIAAALANIVVFLFTPLFKAYAGPEAESLVMIEQSIATVVTGLLGYLLPMRATGLMGVKKKSGTIALLALLATLSPNLASAAPNGRVVISERSVETQTGTATVAELRIAPAVIISAVTVPLTRRREFQAGVDVGGCYVLAYSPSWWDKTGDDPFMSLGPCVEFGLVVDGPADAPEGTNSFTVQAVGMLSVMEWFAAGVGYRHRLALGDGRDNGEWVLQFGLNAVVF